MYCGIESARYAGTLSLGQSSEGRIECHSRTSRLQRAFLPQCGPVDDRARCLTRTGEASDLACRANITGGCFPARESRCLSARCGSFWGVSGGVYRTRGGGCGFGALRRPVL
eukprot:4324122-Lingulodinium_polyedra.AAC.1